jgi:hypothetical protein
VRGQARRSRLGEHLVEEFFRVVVSEGHRSTNPYS